MNSWKTFQRSPMYVRHVDQNYHTWLDEVDYSTPIKFETLSHVTTFENAEDILFTRNLETHRVNDYSCVTKFRFPSVHPLYAKKLLWVNPDTYSTISVEKHGNVRFYTNNLDFLRNMYFYVIEFVDNCSETVCRVLATTSKYKELRRFDVRTEKSGPIYLDTDSGQFVKYNLFKNKHCSQFEHLEIEILLEVPQNVNTIISYVKCENPRYVLKNEAALGHIEAHNDAVGELKYALLRYRHRFNNAFYINPLDAHCQVALTTITRTELTSQWYPLTRNTHCLNNNVDRLVKSLDFIQSLREKEITREDEEVLEDLHYIFTESAEMPHPYVMIHKMLEAVGADGRGGSFYPPFHEIFELFIDHFKSHEAQNLAKKTIGKFLEATYTLDINRTLHGSQIPIATTFQEKLRL